MQQYLSGPFRNLMIVYLLWSASWTLVGSLYNVYLYGQGIPISQIFFSNAFVYLAALFAIPLFRSFNVRHFMLAGIAVSMASVIALVAVPQPLGAFAYQFIAGTTCFIFWVPFNTLYYEFRKGNNAQLGALYYSVGPFLGLVLPALSGWMAESLGFPALFAAAMVVFAATLAATAMFVESRRHAYDFIGSLRAVSGLKSIIFLEGFAAAVIVSVTLGVMLLLYTAKPLEFGVFTSLATVFAIVAALVTARISDRMQRRRELLLAMVACFALSAVFASQAQDIAVFFLAYGLVTFFSRIFFPLPFALAVDNSRDIAATMVGREIMLNVGRLSGVMLGCFMLAAGLSIHTVLLVEGLTLLLYVPVFENRKKKLERH